MGEVVYLWTAQSAYCRGDVVGGSRRLIVTTRYDGQVVPVR